MVARLSSEKRVKLRVLYKINYTVSHITEYRSLYYNGSLTLCVDYLRRNKITEDSSHPCLNIDDKLPEFKEKSVFSKHDNTKAFYNVKVKEEDKPKARKLAEM